MSKKWRDIRKERSPEREAEIAKWVEQEGAIINARVDKVLELTGASKEAFIEALLNPPGPNEEAVAAARMYLELK